MTNIIDLSQVVGSDTLCEYAGYPAFFKLTKNRELDSIRVAQDIWQSTANNLVIPDGLICEYELHHSPFGEKYTEDESELSSNQIFQYRLNHGLFSAIRVTGKQDGWSYPWEVE